MQKISPLTFPEKILKAVGIINFLENPSINRGQMLSNNKLTKQEIVIRFGDD